MSEAGLFQKCPSVGAHSGVTLQQTYYLLFCHFGFSTTNLGQDSISAPEMSDSLTASRALTRAGVHGHTISLTLDAEWVCPSGGGGGGWGKRGASGRGGCFLRCIFS